MADQTLKNQKQNLLQSPASQKGSALSELDSKNSVTQQSNSQSRDIVKQQRDASNVSGVVQQQVFNALFGTKQAQDSVQVKTGTSNTPSRLRSKDSASRLERERRPKHTRSDESSVSAEVREQMAIRAANSARGTASAASNRSAQGNAASLRARSPLDGPDSEVSEDLQQTLVGTDSIPESIPSSIESSSTRSTQTEPRGEALALTPGEALEAIDLKPNTDIQKLLDVVGPEAVLTFREKLQQVWVMLDENQTHQLDVVARMPATLSGSTATELLMIESPQGIHFVAFLKNRNDFEILATFDHRALLPDSPSRQLIEAGIIAYEQVDSVFKEGSQKIEQMIKEIASSRGTNDAVFLGLQRLLVQEKRRRRKFRQTIDHFVDQLDELDLQEDSAEAPFVPNGEFQAESDLELNEETEKDQFSNSTHSLNDVNLDEESQYGVRVED